MIRKILTCLTLVPLVFLAACNHEPSPEETTLTSVGEIAPSFALTTLDGNEFDIEKLRGKVVLVNFWATWCPPCREEIPHLENQVWQQFRDRNFDMIALAREEDEATVRPFVDAQAMQFPVAIDPDRRVFALYAKQFIPRNVVIGVDGQILFQSSGYDEKEFSRMITVIEEALNSSS